MQILKQGGIQMTFTMVVTAWIVGAITGLIKGLIFNPKKGLDLGFNIFGGIIGAGLGFHTLGFFGSTVFDIRIIPTILAAFLLSVIFTYTLNAISIEHTHNGSHIQFTTSLRTLNLSE